MFPNPYFSLQLTRHALLKNVYGAIAIVSATFVSCSDPALSSQVAMFPIIEMNSGGEIRSCGVRTIFVDYGAELDVKLSRSDRAARLTVRGRVEGRRISSLSIDTASVKDGDLFGTSNALEDGSIEREADPNQAGATALIQQFFLSGASIQLHFPDGETLRLQLDGTSPNSVRQAYLNCAGDLFR
ncbi:MAG: hypothetical protein JSR78_04275 [Proteobacteria bacterium]|nr:hypothetical protein [Pseudomonadota bacterium]